MADGFREEKKERKTTEPREAQTTNPSHVLQRPLLHALLLECHLAAADHLLNDLVIDAALCVLLVGHARWEEERKGLCACVVVVVVVVGIDATFEGADSPLAGSTS